MIGNLEEEQKRISEISAEIKDWDHDQTAEIKVLHQKQQSSQPADSQKLKQLAMAVQDYLSGNYDNIKEEDLGIISGQGSLLSTQNNCPPDELLLDGQSLERTPTLLRDSSQSSSSF
jgi:hypothetical protein